MNCVYCRIPTDGSEPPAHAFPEAVVANDLFMPAGSVCSVCNSYFGTRLDPAVVSHPVIALYVQLMALPGKKGVRQQVGPVSRHNDGSVSIEIPPPSIDGAQQAHLEVGPGRKFNIGRFRRALHYLAFNTVVLQTSPIHALKPHYDPVRHYVRRPKPHEAWPFALVHEPSDPIRPEVRGRIVSEGPGETVCIRLFNFDFYVDVLNRGRLEYWAQQTFGEAVEIADAHWKPPPHDATGPVRYRMRVHPKPDNGAA